MTATIGISPRPVRSPARHAAPAAPAAGLWRPAAALALLALLVPLHDSWAVQALLVPVLLTLPGVLLLRALRIPGAVIAEFPVYVPGASIVVLLASGLAVDLLGPLVGVGAPLRTVPLLLGLEVICAGLLAAGFRAGEQVRIPWRDLPRPAWLAGPLIVPLLAAAGALRLNGGHGAGLAVAALAACLILLLAAVIWSGRLGQAQLIAVLYAAGLAVMWAFSLRGSLVYGFDIATEYRDLQQAIGTGIWHTGHHGDAYGAMLSVAVMPAELHFLSGLPGLLIFKVAYPAIGALFPVAVFGLARLVLAQRWAFVAAVIIVMQGTFAQEVPGLARQEVALVLFAALLMAMLDSRVPRRPQWSLVALLSLAMVVSHYSTTYVALLLIGLPLALQFAVSWFRAIPRVTGAVAIAFVAALAGAALWYGPVTNSGSGLGGFAQAVRSQGLNVLPAQAAGGGLLAAYLQSGNPPTMPAGMYQGQVEQYYSNHLVKTVPLPKDHRYHLRNLSPPTPAVTMPLVHGGLSLGLFVVEQLINVLGAIGALLLALRRHVPVAMRQVGLLGVASLVFLAAIRVSSTLASAYNQERAFLQALAILAISLAWCLQALAGRGVRRQAGVVAAAAGSLGVLFTSSSGLMGALAGGGTAANLASSGEDYERYYTSTPELAAASWLGANWRDRDAVYADRYAELRLLALTDINGRLIYPDVAPGAISVQAWVYASQTNTVDGLAQVLWRNHQVTFRFPAAFLNAYYDVVYTNGSSKVFHR
jgi:uncharacterized membrane protein